MPSISHCNDRNHLQMPSTGRFERQCLHGQPLFFTGVSRLGTINSDVIRNFSKARYVSSPQKSTIVGLEITTNAVFKRKSGRRDPFFRFDRFHQKTRWISEFRQHLGTRELVRDEFRLGRRIDRASNPVRQDLGHDRRGICGFE